MSRVSQAAQKERGSILILVLLVISILVVTVMESIRLARVESMGSKIFSGSLNCRPVAASGIAFAKYLLLQDLKEKDRADHLGEAWSGFLKQDEVFLPPLEVGRLNGTITDEQGKFPINFLIDDDGESRPEYIQVFTRLLSSPPLELPPEKVEELTQSIKDWIDTDDTLAGEFGAEKEYYASHGRGRSCRNAPVKALGELGYVRGMTREILEGTAERSGLNELITVYSNGKININTASRPILAAMVNPGVNQDTARKFSDSAAKYRTNRQHFDFLQEKDWYRNRMSGFNDIQLPSELVATQSDYFSVLLQASIGNISLTRFAVFNRAQNKDQTTIRTLITETR